MALYDIKHRTVYEYALPVTVSHHSAHIRPLSNSFQTCRTFRLTVDPEPQDVEVREDYYDNITHMFSIEQHHQSLVMETVSQVEVNSVAPILTHITMTCADARATSAAPIGPEMIMSSEFLYPTEITPDSPELHAFAKATLTDEKPIGQAVLDFLDVFKDEFEFDPTATDVSTPIAEVLKTRRGVCQDFAHLMIAAFRSCGIYAKYVSGYILSHPPTGMPRLEGADASHAWVSVFIPTLGWVEIDPTNRLVVGDEHVRVAYGRDYTEVSMLNGAVHGGGAHSITVAVTVIPIDG